MARPQDPSKDLRQIILNENVGSSNTTSDWAIFYSQEPNTPDRAITCLTFGAPNPSPKFLLENCNVQVRVRGKRYDYDNTYDKIQEVKDAILGRSPITVNNSDYRGIYVTNDIALIDYDESERPTFRIDVRLTREPQNSTSQTHRSAI